MLQFPVGSWLTGFAIYGCGLVLNSICESNPKLVCALALDYMTWKGCDGKRCGSQVHRQRETIQAKGVLLLPVLHFGLDLADFEKVIPKVQGMVPLEPQPLIPQTLKK